MTDALAVHYADALADVVFEPGSALKPQKAVEQLRVAASLLGSSPELHRVLLSPAVAREKKIAVVGELVEDLGLDRVVRNFLQVIVEHRRVGELSRMVEGFEAAVDDRLGLVRVEITSAVELTEEQKQELLHALGTATGKFIHPLYKIDPSILGGVIATVGSKQFDGSVLGGLEAMRRHLSAAS